MSMSIAHFIQESSSFVASKFDFVRAFLQSQRIGRRVLHRVFACDRHLPEMTRAGFPPSKKVA